MFKKYYYQKIFHRYKTLSFKKHTNNIGSRKVMMTNEVIREKSEVFNCMFDKSRFVEQKPNKKSSGNNINPKFFIY